MIYLIESSDYILIQSKIKEILNKNKLSQNNIIKYDLLETSISSLIEDLDTFNLLVDRKVIIGDNAYFLSASKIKGNVEHNELDLEKYINNPNLDNILILICNKLDGKRKIVKLLREKTTIISSDINIQSIIKGNLEDYKMDNITINFLINYCNNDNERIMNELEKLKCYKLDEKEILKSDIEKIVLKPDQDNIFSLIDAIVLKKSKRAYEIYKDILTRGEDISKIVIMVADQFRLILQSKRLRISNYTESEIASKLKVHPYRVKLALEKGYNYPEGLLQKNLVQLANIDIMIKSGSSNPNLAFSSFLINL